MKYKIIDNVKTKDVSKTLKCKLNKNGFIEDDYNFDIGIAVGGDGTFLKMIRDTNFNSDILYVGINAGTLCFSGEVDLNELDIFIEELKNLDYQIEDIGIQETTIISKEESKSIFSINEITIRDSNLNTIGLDVKIDDVLLERFVGDGLLISTSFGSTAYNMSLGGCIVLNTFNSLQITPIAALNSNKYRNILNSILIPNNSVISLIPFRSKNIVICYDGYQEIFENVIKIKTSINNKKIKCLRRKNYNFISKLNNRFI